MSNAPKLKVAIVADWLTGIGGAERVVLELHKMYPWAPIYTSQYDPAALPWFKGADVRTTWLQKLPKSLRKFLPVFRRWAFERLDLNEYDLIISSSGAEAKAVKKRPGAIHICYCHSPTHYYWVRYDEYIRSPGFGVFDPLARLGLKLLIGPMRKWDKKAAQRPDIMLANSTFTKDNIKKYYGRDSLVVYPPVDTARFQMAVPRQRKGFVIAGRQTPYKRIDLAVTVCTKLGLPLKVLGDGPEHDRLQKMASPSISFVRNASDEQMAQYFGAAQALIFPGMEDFGITAVEALAAGTPVIAYGAGGVLDYVQPDKTGLFFNEQTVESLAAVLQEFPNHKFDSDYIQASAQPFSSKRFRQEIQKFINKVTNDTRA